MTNKLIAFFAPILLITSCIGDDLQNLKTTNWSPEVAVPLVNSNLTVRDILDETDTEIIVVDENTRQIALVYNDELVSIAANDLLALPDFDVEQSINFTQVQIDALIQNGNYTLNNTQQADFSNETDMELESITFEEGIIEIEITSDIDVSGTLEIELPDFMRNGQPLKRSIPVQYSSGQTVITEQINLNNYRVDLASGAQGYNQFGIEYTFHADYEGQNVSVADLLNIKNTFKQLRFLRLYGNIGKIELFDDSGEIILDVFNNSEGGFFQLTNPQVILTVNNSFGVPVDVEIDQFTSTNNRTGITQNLLLTNFTNSFGIASPNIGDEGETAQTTLEINPGNSNIGDIIQPAPQTINYAVNSVSNPGSNTSPVNLPNFVTNLSEISLETEVLLPLEGLAHSFILADTLDFNLGDDLSPIDSFSLRLAVNNGFPLGTKVQLYFLNELFEPVDSLFNGSTPIFSPAQINGDGIVTNPAQTTTDIGYGAAKTNNIQNAQHIAIRAELETRDGQQGQIVKILDTYNIEVQLGMYITAKVDEQL